VDVEEYEYDQLPASKRRIRLLQLRSGTIDGQEIYCELIEADYNNDFHIPTKPMDDDEEDDLLRETKPDTKRSTDTISFLVWHSIIILAISLMFKFELRFSQFCIISVLSEIFRSQKVLLEKLGIKRREEKVVSEEVELEERLKLVEAHELKYEALSWCWGKSAEDYTVLIDRHGKTYKKRVRKDLALALKYLRKPDATRTLWIDAICINQADDQERNQQVQMMSRVYTRAKEVCIWLGEDTHESKVAIDFISREITQLTNFDAISSDKTYTEKWHALMMLMQREWFSRRWVVQEIALARRARIYCGPDSISWKDFAVAVELFVEVETATHRLSEVMQKDEKFRHVPGWFEHVSELGASLLVQATGKVFRAQRTPLDGNDDGNEEYKWRASTIRAFQTIDPLDRRSLLSLEYLVTTMFIFQATECRDSIYSMLAIARDANPYAETSLRTDDLSIPIMSLFDSFLAEKPFAVDYARPYADVCRDFVEFCINRKTRLDPAQALDILCRPWALEPQKGTSIRLPRARSDQAAPPKRRTPKKTFWETRDCKVIVKNKYSNLFVNKAAQPRFEYRYRSTKTEDPRRTKEYWLAVDKSYGEYKTHKDGWKVPDGWERVERHFRSSQEAGTFLGLGSRAAVKSRFKQADHDLDLPSWISRASKAPFKIFDHPGIGISKTGRANADPLVGSPQDGHRNYSAAQTEPVQSAELKFRRRPILGHYSLYVTGFELDEVLEVQDPSQGGDIPQSWLELGGWNEPYSTDPPADFWRTIVADRGHDNRNPPVYYARACKESVRRGGVASGRVATTDLINNERNSIIAEFCRRVHAVIWGRSLFKTKGGRLGLAAKVQPGDKVCILYGCTVPVILGRYEKKPGALEDEQFEDRIETFKHLMHRMEKKQARKAKYLAKARSDPGWKTTVQHATVAANIKIAQANAKLPQSGEHTGGEGRVKGAQKQERSQLKIETEKAKKEDPYLYYVFKGESYIHGLMDGDALREKFYEEIPDRVFELR
tara:strand:- start:5380 stop:8391 length:3012 start_codon:yes stop_codon:yes gene_type:complete